MKQQEVTQKVIGDSTFYIRPFPAFTAAKIGGELASTLTPILGSLAPLMGSVGKDEEGNAQFMDMDVQNAFPAFADALSKVSGDQFETIMQHLLVDYGNVSVSNDEVTNGKPRKLDLDIANEIFCLEVQDMFVLCFEVVKLNFGGFFKKLGIQSGNLLEAAQKVVPSKNTESST